MSIAIFWTIIIKTVGDLVTVITGQRREMELICHLKWNFLEKQNPRTLKLAVSPVAVSVGSGWKHSRSRFVLSPLAKKWF
jgi:hypothetical protein